MSIFIDEAKSLTTPISVDSDFINSRYQIYHSELQNFTTGSYLPDLVYYLFYEDPLKANPENSTNMKEIFLFSNAFPSMQDHMLKHSKLL